VNPRYELVATGSGEVRDKDGNLITQEEPEQETEA